MTSGLDSIPTDDILKTLKERCATLSGSQKRILLLGPPGCGKGTQSEWLKSEMGLTHLSTGDMFRAAIAAQSEVGKKAEAIIKAGELVPDDIVLAVIAEKFKELSVQPNFRGYILDGFPRTVQQAEGLDRLLKESGAQLNAVFNFTVDDQVLKRRVCGRRIHLPSGRTYHVEFRPPKVPDRDDVTGEPLVHRSDDNEESFDTRLELYKKATAPLIDYYQKRGLIFRIDAAQPPEMVRRDIETLFAIGDLYNDVPSPQALTTTTTGGPIALSATTTTGP